MYKVNRECQSAHQHVHQEGNNQTLRQVEVLFKNLQKVNYIPRAKNSNSNHPQIMITLHILCHPHPPLKNGLKIKYRVIPYPPPLSGPHLMRYYFLGVEP